MSAFLSSSHRPLEDDAAVQDTNPDWGRPPSLVAGVGGVGAELSFLNMAPPTTTTVTNNSTASESESPFYSLSATDIRGQEYYFSQLRGRVVLIVNVASKCGFTPQYKGLQTLYEKYRDQGFVIVGFPCDQFGNQEPADESDIEVFCQLNYGVTFPMMSKVHVNGVQTHPVYEFLKKQQKQAFMEMIKWNFEKFLIDKEGNVVQRFSSMADPFKHIEPALEKVLAA